MNHINGCVTVLRIQAIWRRLWYTITCREMCHLKCSVYKNILLSLMSSCVWLAWYYHGEPTLFVCRGCRESFMFYLFVTSQYDDKCEISRNQRIVIVLWIHMKSLNYNRRTVISPSKWRYIVAIGCGLDTQDYWQNVYKRKRRMRTWYVM